MKFPNIAKFLEKFAKSDSRVNKSPYQKISQISNKYLNLNLGVAGNKGAISFRFKYYQSSFCFTCGHFSGNSNETQQRDGFDTST